MRIFFMYMHIDFRFSRKYNLYMKSDKMYKINNKINVILYKSPIVK